MGKAITEELFRKMFGVLLLNTPLDGVDDDTAKWVLQNPREAGNNLNLFFCNGCKFFEDLTEPVLDFLVRVDRSVKPIYPDWVGKLMHPELEFSGPAEYDLSKVEQWVPKDLRGIHMYDQLKKEEVLAACLNLQDGLAIQQKDIVVFRKLYRDKDVFLWGSVVRHRDKSGLYVPYLIEEDNKVVVNWCGLDDYRLYGKSILRPSK